MNPELTIPEETLRTFRTMRARIRDFGASFAPEELFRIPPGFSNSIGWNLAHIWVTHQLLCYRLSGLPLLIEEEAVRMYGKGSSPADWEAAPAPASILTPLTELADRFEEDLAAGRFGSFTPYTTSAGIELRSLAEAVEFNALHEGLHLGYAMAIRRALAGTGA